MSESSSVKEILEKAKEEEERYEWPKAADHYQKALTAVVGSDSLRKGEIFENLAYAIYKAAFQADYGHEFREKMRQTLACYAEARKLHETSTDTEKTARTSRCNAMIDYIRYWLAPDVPEKKRLLRECWRLTKEALKALEDVGNGHEYGLTYVKLSSVARLSNAFEWDFGTREKTTKEAAEYGEKAIIFLSSAGDPSELARAYVETAAYLNMLIDLRPSLDSFRMYNQKSLSYWEKAVELSEENAFLQLLESASPGIPHNFEQSVKDYEKGLNLAKKARDKALIGCALDWLAFCTRQSVYAIDEPSRRIEVYQRALQYAEDAKQQFSIISFISLRSDFWIQAPHAEHFWDLALWEIDPQKRRGFLERAVEEGTHATMLAGNTGYPEVMVSVHHVLSKALVSLAQTELELEEKKKLIEEALKHRKESIEINDQVEPFSHWNQGVFSNYLADLKTELSNVEQDTEKRRQVLAEAVSDKERGLQLCSEMRVVWETVGEPSNFAVLGRYQYSYGESLIRLHSFTNDEEHQRRAIKAFEEAALSFQKLDMFSRVAECRWKAAGSWDSMGEHLKATQNFKMASDDYESAAGKIPQLKDLYHDHALYMQAWSEIEKARHHHKRQEYASAEEHFQKAADLHKSLKQWSYLTPNYLAWAKVEQAEDLSRKERSEDAIQAFEQAAELFNETKKRLQTHLDKIENTDEEQMAKSIAKATDERREYCIGRIVLEEARILDKQGDHYSSSEKYGSAAETFERLSKALPSEQERREFKFIIGLSRAWQKMAQAEAEESGQHYDEASQLFEAAKDSAQNEKTKALVLGHSHLCRALEAGAKFTDTRDMTERARAMQHLEIATSYYLKADFQSASEYTKATRFLLDAYVHMGEAAKETDPEKKARLYTLAQKLLQASADAYAKTNNPSRREQALKLLETADEQRELAFSLAEVLRAPMITSTAAFATPSPTFERAAGLERFEHAEVNANLILSKRELRVGESLDLEVELANPGRSQALLTQIEEAFPESFDLATKPELYRVEGHNINMKGKRLDPLKTEEIKFSVKPKRKGSFTVRPRILYVDENGNLKSHQPEPVTITVKELGIKGWIAGDT